MSPPVPPPPDTPPQRLHRRVIASVLWALALGAATTIVIAWALALCVNIIYHPGQLTMRRSPQVAWSVQEYRWFGTLTEDWSPQQWYSVPMLTHWDELSADGRASITKSVAVLEQNITDLLNWPGTLVSQKAPRVFPHERFLTPDGPRTLTEHHRGWPLLALGCARVVEPVPKASTGADILKDGWHWGIPFRNQQSASWDVDCVALPLKPLFPGFYLNTALFASLWWAALFWRPLRRRRRIARGQCPACAYSLAGLPAGADRCPECGASAPPAALQAAAGPTVPTENAAG